MISGTPRQNSMKITEIVRTIGRFERRPSASKTPSGSDPTMPVDGDDEGDEEPRPRRGLTRHETKIKIEG